MTKQEKRRQEKKLSVELQPKAHTFAHAVLEQAESCKTATIKLNFHFIAHCLKAQQITLKIRS